MYQQNDDWTDEMAMEIQAIVDLVDANVSPITDAEAWEAEIAARQQGEREEPQPLVDDELEEVIEISTTLA